MILSVSTDDLVVLVEVLCPCWLDVVCVDMEDKQCVRSHSLRKRVYGGLDVLSSEEEEEKEEDRVKGHE